MTSHELSSPDINLLAPESSPLTVYSDDWRKIDSPVERRRAQNRVAQRARRKSRSYHTPSTTSETGRPSSKDEALSLLFETSPLNPDVLPNRSEWSSVSSQEVRCQYGEHKGQAEAFSKDLDQILEEMGVKHGTHRHSILADGTHASSSSDPLQSFGTAYSSSADKLAMNTDTQSLMGNTALHEAVLSGSVEMVGLLLDYGPNLTKQNASGMTPLHLAVQKGNVILARMLSESGQRLGCDVDIANIQGLTPLHYAVMNKNVEIAKLLLEAGSNVDAIIGLHDL